MKALVKSKAKTGLWMEEVPKPTITENEVLIKIKKTSICGTDLHIYKWDNWAQRIIQLPLIIGHEFMGEIVKVGASVAHLAVGDRVSGEGHITCGYCKNCRDSQQYLCPNTKGLGIHRQGAFAEYLAFPASNVIKAPEKLSDDVVTILDPLGNAVHCVLKFSIAGESVLITGAGPIGLMSIAVCKMIGAKHTVITDVNDFRLKLAKKLGATRTLNIHHAPLNPIMKELKLIDGFSVCLEMSGSTDGLPLLLNSISHGGHLALLGIPQHAIAVDCNQIIFKGLTIKGIYGRKMFETWDKMFDLLETGLDINPVITHHFDVTNYQEAFETALSGKAGKVIINWS